MSDEEVHSRGDSHPPSVTPMDLEENEEASDPTTSMLPFGGGGATSSTATAVAGMTVDPPPTSLDEDLLTQIRELSLEEAQTEWLEAARYDDLDVLHGLWHIHHQPHPQDEQQQQSQLHPLLDHCDPTNGNTALHMAAANGHASVVQFLLDRGANPHLSNSAGNTALHWASANGHDIVVAQLIQIPCVDVLQRNAFGRSALTEGFSSDNAAVVKALLEHDSASEERLLSTSTGGGGVTVEEDESDDPMKTPDDAATMTTATTTTATLVQELVFSGVEVRVREVAMATNESQSIVGQDAPEHDRTGLGIWAASLVAAHWMSHLPLGASDDDNDATASPLTILELGAGCGCPSLVLARKYPTARVWATDWNPEVVRNLRHNVELNGLSDNSCAWQMDWNDPTTWPPDPKPRVIIGADLIYETSMAELLASVVARLLPRDNDNDNDNNPGGGPPARFYYVAPQAPRQGSPAFLAQLRQHGLRIVSCTHAPAEYVCNPLVSQDDDECFVHFNELMSSSFVLYEFAWEQQ